MKLNQNEKIDSWDVVVRTTKGRKLEFMKDLRLEVPNTAAELIDEELEDNYPVTWAGEDGEE